MIPASVSGLASMTPISESRRDSSSAAGTRFSGQVLRMRRVSLWQM
jgi:hypothetical protein